MIAVIFALGLAVSMLDPSGSQVLDQSAQPASAASTPTGQKRPAHDPNQVVCRTEDLPGSNMKSRTCKTRMEWTEQDHAVRQFFKDSSNFSAQQVPVAVPSAF